MRLLHAPPKSSEENISIIESIMGHFLLQNHYCIVKCQGLRRHDADLHHWWNWDLHHMLQNRCPSSHLDCHIAIKKYRNKECMYEFPKKQKNWERVKERGKISPTHEREKLEFRVNVIWKLLSVSINAIIGNSGIQKATLFSPTPLEERQVNFLGMVPVNIHHPRNVFSIFLGHHDGLKKWTNPSKEKGPHSQQQKTNKWPLLHHRLRANFK
ncbi:uncharacterized protein [Montipora foliosa]|uniref:uncharacterized protein n=1 Tax=Montipora foliosa TaxID=591990 RepID=UPI0035F1FC46